MTMHPISDDDLQQSLDHLTKTVSDGVARQSADVAVLHGKVAELTARLDSTQAAAKAAGDLAGQVHATLASPRGPYATPRGLEPTGARAARLIRALAAANGIKSEAARIAAELYGDELLAKDLATSPGSAGGFLVPQALSAEIIELLRPASVVMSLGARTLPMPNGNLTIPAVAAGATVSYVGETQEVPKSAPTLRQVSLQAKKMAALVPISNDLLRFASVAADQFVREDLVRALAARGDAAFIRGDGTGNAPKGLRSLAAPGNVIAATAPVDLAAVTADLGRLELLLLQANMPMGKPGWLFAPRTQVFLQNLRDANGNLVFGNEMAGGTLRGKPFRATTHIPVDLGGDGSEIYLADFAEAIIGEVQGIVIDVFPGGTYDDAGTLRSGMSRDETVIRAIQQHDFALRHDAAAAVLTGVRWLP